MLGSIKHFIVLQNIDNNIFIIIPGCALPRQLTMDGNVLSVQVLLDRRNQEWINGIGDIKCYFFPVHDYQGQIIDIHSFAFISAYSYQLCLTCYLVKFSFRFFVAREFIFTPSLASSLYIFYTGNKVDININHTA